MLPLSLSLTLDPEWSFPLILKDFRLVGFSYTGFCYALWDPVLSVVLLSGFRLAVEFTGLQVVS